MMRFATLALLLMCAAAPLAAEAVRGPSAADFVVTFDNNGASDYLLTSASSVSDPSLYSGTFPANDPTISLQVGKRYEFIVVNSGFHPLQIVSLGASSGADVVLLSQGSAVGSFESDPDVDFQENAASSNGSISFVLTPQLAEAMDAANTPGYRCGIHTGTMRGQFAISTATPTPSPSPTPTVTPTVTPAPTGPDFSWVFGDNGVLDYVLLEDGISDPSLFAGPFPAEDPTINLIVGKRYRVTVVNPDFHPIDIIAADPGQDPLLDIPLLAMAGGEDGTFENDPEVNFFDAELSGNSYIEFTLTQALWDAMRDNSGGVERVPGYRCDFHAVTMRGNFNITTPIPTPTTTATPTITVTATATSTITATPTVVPTTTVPTATPTPTPEPVSLVVEGLTGLRTPMLARDDRNSDGHLDAADTVADPHGHHHGH